MVVLTSYRAERDDMEICKAAISTLSRKVAGDFCAPDRNAQACARAQFNLRTERHGCQRRIVTGVNIVTSYQGRPGLRPTRCARMGAYQNVSRPQQAPSIGRDISAQAL